MQELVSNFKMVDVYSCFLNAGIRNRIPYLEARPSFSYESSMFRQMIYYFGSLHKLPVDDSLTGNQITETLQSSPV